MRCSSSLLSRNFEKLIQCDQRLYQLSQQPAIILDSPVFETKRSVFENPNESDGPSHKFIDLASSSVVSSVFENDGLKPLMLKQPECFSRPMNLGNYIGAGSPPCHSLSCKVFFPDNMNFLRCPCFKCPRKFCCSGTKEIQLV